MLPLLQLVCTLLLIGDGASEPVGSSSGWLVVGNQGLFKAVRDPIESPALKVLYQPLRAGQRLAAQITIEMIVHPMTTGLAGALMLASIPYEPAPSACFSRPFMLWILAVLPTTCAYLAALMDVRKRTIDDE